MKNFRITSIALFMLTTFSYFGCEPQVDVPKPENSILPERFGVDIPGSLSSEYAVGNGRVSAVDTLKGNDIYNHLNLFINVGEGAAELVGEIIRGIGIYHINKPMSFSFESDEDGRTKTLIVEEKPYFDGASWEFVLTITNFVGFFQAAEGDDWDGDGVDNWADAQPSNPAVSNLVVTIEFPADGSTVD